MNNKLVEELREWKNKWYGGLTKAGVLVEFNEILSRHSDKVEEPLAVLAVRKGWDRVHISEFRGSWYFSLWGYGTDSPATKFPFEDTTYALAEAKARAYLEGLPDTGKGGK